MQNEYSILSKVESAVKNILDELSGHQPLEGLYRKFEGIASRMAEPMQLAIIGKISSSKSTLVNAMLGEAEVVRTGAMEETWNVSWLKYGNPQEDLVVHFKNGEIERVPRSRWAEWANRDRGPGNKLKDTVSYIEVTYGHEILKEINIIDTPGLDSFYSADSQNTLDFLKQVKPDAVIMLFSKSINADTLSVIEDFRQGIGSGFSPINAMGVMAKIDDIWEADPELEPVAEARRVIGGLMTQDVVRNTLFDILPVSALVALSGQNIGNEELESFRQLSVMDDKILNRLFKSAKRFLSPGDDIPLDVPTREVLLRKFGRYAIWLLTGELKRNPNAGPDELRRLLLGKSGFQDFIEVVRDHFGERAALIKIYSIIFSLSADCHRFMNRPDCGKIEKEILRKVNRHLDDLIAVLSLEFKVIDIATAYYEGKLSVGPEEFEELRRVKGEFGFSCTDRLGITGETDIDGMRKVVADRIYYWRMQCNTRGILFPSDEPFMKLMVDTYSLLEEDIVSAYYKLQSANKFLFGK